MTPIEGTGFRDREDAAKRLAAGFRVRPLHDPLVLGIPRGGVVTAAVLARELGAELDVVLARKLRAPLRPEFALGAVGEDGRVTLNGDEWDLPGVTEAYLAAETAQQLQEIGRRTRLIRAVRPRAPLAGRSVIVADDGIATGSTMIAALTATRAHRPRELIAAAPVAPPDRLAEVRRWCDAVVCPLTPTGFRAVGEFYDQFDQVEDDEVLGLLRAAWASRNAGMAGPNR